MMNTSSSHDDFFYFHSNISSTHSPPGEGVTLCFYSGPSSTIFTIFIIIYIVFVLSLCIPIVYDSFQKWKRKSSTSFSVTSLSDRITYHTVILETVGIFGGIICLFGSYKSQYNIFKIGNFLFFLTWYGEILFHILLCLEHYLAVVHPITYLSLKNKKGIRIRNMSICCVWPFSFVFILVFVIKQTIIPEFCLLVSALTFDLFCGFSVLCVLIRPGPGEPGVNRTRVDQSKQRAFFTIICILGVLVVRFSSNIILELMNFSGSNDCAAVVCFLWFNLPGNLLIPVLFLHKERKFELKNKQKG
ncbi:uncharacterized protein LOC108250223 isoform X2 [Kryptolebias marmoratus]|nr:uncharacterized protein LOC108250223 isoform X2 [Kryptolebias marmoratus]XP_037832315.1 uncharacterized protein LOC108250223 isoform X2 [Kryptolebias marmoratus]